MIEIGTSSVMTSERSNSVPILLRFAFSLEDFHGVETEACDIFDDYVGEVMER